MKCWQCEINNSDNATRIFKDVKSGRIFKGTRNFCSDECETNYINAMDKKYPELAKEFQLISVLSP